MSSPQGGRATGAYVFLFSLPEAGQSVIGRLGTFSLPKGRYAYVGSALNGLEPRVGRHLRRGGKKHWHIDHLTERAVGMSAYLVLSERDIECQLSAAVGALPGAIEPVKGFGSSDCRCRSHLFFLEPRAVAMLRTIMNERGAYLVRMRK
jgi:sugar fermentation stimulation protein A